MIAAADSIPCPDCYGAGRRGAAYLREDCPRCEGHGRVPSNGVSAELGTALQVLVEIHTSTDDKLGYGFILHMGKVPPISRDAEYVAAWRTVRRHLGLPCDPGPHERAQ